jgi:hypothetical protein
VLGQYYGESHINKVALGKINDIDLLRRTLIDVQAYKAVPDPASQTTTGTLRGIAGFERYDDLQLRGVIALPTVELLRRNYATDPDTAPADPAHTNELDAAEFHFRKGMEHLSNVPPRMYQSARASSALPTYALSWPDEHKRRLANTMGIEQPATRAPDTSGLPANAAAATSKPELVRRSLRQGWLRYGTEKST